MLLEFKGKEKKKEQRRKLEIFGQSAGAPTTFQNAQGSTSVTPPTHV